ncbi:MULTISPECIES: acetate uptake transporter [unclassified Streptomyces]|uniref:acetate uptake transporter n=1 Tax=unclassified Streptomyces TaxID=2593676 RepID=UPI0033DB6494
MDNDVSTARSAGVGAAALGYLALGLTLIAYGLFSTGVIDNAAAADAARLALFVGGITQFVAGMWEFYGGNGFTGTAFASLGAFWVTWSGGSGAGASKEVVGLFMLLWALLALTLTMAAWQMGGVAQAAFGLLTVSAALSGIAALASNGGLGKVAGWIGLVAGVVAWYGGTALLTNAAWGRRALADGWRLGVPHRGHAA